jgi:hypothetical protein
MHILFLILLFSLSHELCAISTTKVQKKPQSSTTANFGNQVIRLTDAEYQQLISLPLLDAYIAPDQTVMVKDLIRILLSNYTLSKPHIMCIRAPCPQPAILIISKGSTRVEIDLTDSPFSTIINSLNIY